MKEACTRKVIHVTPAGAQLVQMRTTLKAYQSAVGGYIEAWPYGPKHPQVYVNEDGRATLAVFAHLDGHPVAGPILAVVESRDLTDADLVAFRARLWMVA